jgi:uncharacterized membrane protein
MGFFYLGFGVWVFVSLFLFLFEALNLITDHGYRVKYIAALIATWSVFAVAPCLVFVLIKQLLKLA